MTFDDFFKKKAYLTSSVRCFRHWQNILTETQTTERDMEDFVFSYSDYGFVFYFDPKCMIH